MTERKTAPLILKKSEKICDLYGLDIYETPMTTDCAANMLKSTSNLLRYVCFCHIINTIISKAINTAKCHPDFQGLIP